MSEKTVEEGIIQLIKKAETELPNDVTIALQHALTKEHGVAKLQIKTMLKAVETAQKTKVPLCQDTGILTFFVKIGQNFPYSPQIKTWIQQAVIRATTEIPIRPNAVDPISRKNTCLNTADLSPHLIYEYTSGSHATITAFPKGSGSENMSKLWMLAPSTQFDRIEQLIVDAVREAGGKPCPPTILGIGIGGSADQCLQLAKYALLRPLGAPHPDKILAQREQKIIRQCNQTGIGPMGLGGKTTVLAAHIETAPCHPASMPVGLIMQCWANRHATMIINADLSWEIL
ncbi:MAG: fumarate hydratase [Candidatus Thermoplasmatota archaeon]